MDKFVADNYPTLIQECHKRQAEFIAHGLSQRHIIHEGMSEADERQVHSRLGRGAGKDHRQEAAGMVRSGLSRVDPHPESGGRRGRPLHLRLGQRRATLQDDVKQGELYSLGPNAYLDDEYIHLYGRRTINEVNLLWRDWFDGLYADGAKTGRMMIFNLHPWVIGQPWRIRHLDEVLGHICSHASVWKATGSEIVDWYKAHA